ncbi:Deoxyribonuclease II family protein [Trichomonas vaginalis G3]|uniref:Deoxyribonuclease II family protein n=1 Tax=Trichomonas vaginalis (strain ATCC PRA-98 / G3) TaxID=412133 RepID=A2FA36_TRIV3|nr:deoxyribonuclease II protein [Trichomonas vaginalis G3]EAX98244.1 Deoxyribonuclease II family protein [Trichomonas vaginalis G3]KAI5543385.1 deoxyribonuclease II protein [Trichomonas vaginalis G3]|eukprot:XP_001311174.1 Deoxyribonuclease II family protein [Trichomonas vaginalis G3]
MLFSLLSTSLCSLQCKNNRNFGVDWFAMFKLPPIKDKNPNHATGMAFFYTDPSTSLAEATSDVGSKNGNPLYYTLSPMYSKDSEIGYMLISDQPPHRITNPSDTYAHKKGVLIYDKDNGLYLEHSVPRYPNDPQVTTEYSYPDTGTNFGQSMLCTSLTHEQINDWAYGMLIERGYVVSYNAPSFTDLKMPNLRKVIDGEWIEKEVKTKVTDIQLKTRSFKLFSKCRFWGLDLYHDLIAPTFSTNVISETWARGTGTMTSNCTGAYKANNILTVSLGDVSWSRMNDHSKWAVAGDYVCIGGINRQDKQLERGGGTWCMKDANFATLMRKSASEIEQCP